MINVFVVKPLKEGEDLAEAIAAKDLTVDFSIKREDEIGKILKAILRAKDNLKQIIMEAQQSSDQVASASELLSESLVHVNSCVQDMTNFVENMAGEWKTIY
jgi:methyl-accepting chemotaxis protein